MVIKLKTRVSFSFQFQFYFHNFKKQTFCFKIELVTKHTQFLKTKKQKPKTGNELAYQVYDLDNLKF